MKRTARSRGEIVAATLAESWRPQPTKPSLKTTEVASISPLLLQSGAGALAWWRLRSFPLATEPAFNELQQAYRLHAIQSALHETNIQRAFTILRSAGVEPILVKGWAIARLYPEPGLRPYGDIDLCVRPDQFTSAQAVLRENLERCPVDLHVGMKLLHDQDWHEVFERSQLLTLGNVQVRVPAPEDNFRILCFHLLRHGVERPIGLCDIAVALETHYDDFDWKICLGSARKHTDWIRCVIGLAKELLGADVGGLPFTLPAVQPSWIVKSILKAWGENFAEHFSNAAPLNFYARHPRGLARALAARWPTPIAGTVGVGGSFNHLPRFPYQFGYLVVRSLRFLRQSS